MVVKCGGCGNEFEGKTSRARFCSATCRVKVNRGDVVPPDPDAGDETPRFVELTRADLIALGKLDSTLGAQVLVIAERMTSAYSTGTEVSNLSKEHTRLMALLSKGAAQADPVDEMKARRERKARKASG